MKTKKIIYILLLLTLLQLSRMLFEKIIFLFIDRNILSQKIVTMIFMIIVIVVSILIVRKKHIKINFFPKKFNYKYIISTIILGLFIITSFIFSKTNILYQYVAILSGSIVTVIFEEIIFRGFVYGSIEKNYNKLYTFIICTILFGIWHIGYVDIIIFRTSLFFESPNILNIMIGKVIVGIGYGMILWLLRYKSKNVYSCVLFHSFLNTFLS